MYFIFLFFFYITAPRPASLPKCKKELAPLINKRPSWLLLMLWLLPVLLVLTLQPPLVHLALPPFHLLRPLLQLGRHLQRPNLDAARLRPSRRIFWSLCYLFLFSFLNSRGSSCVCQIVLLHLIVCFSSPSAFLHEQNCIYSMIGISDTYIYIYWLYFPRPSHVDINCVLCLFRSTGLVF